MSTATLTTLFAVLTLIALAGALVMTPIAGRFGFFAPVRGTLQRRRNAVAWLVAATATAGSLYYSEVANFIPCELCWYQRIFMYPLVVVILVGILRRDVDVRYYVVPMAGIGAAISTYHYLLQRFPSWQSGACDIEAPCTLRWVWELGFISIPMMALAGFLFIGSLMVFGGRSR